MATRKITPLRAGNRPRPVVPFDAKSMLKQGKFHKEALLRHAMELPRFASRDSVSFSMANSPRVEMFEPDQTDRDGGTTYHFDQNAYFDESNKVNALTQIDNRA
jgi:hypothetical protein